MIQKAIVDRTNSRSPNSDHNHFGGQVLLWEGLWSFFSVQPLSWLEKEMATHSISLPGEYRRQRSLVGYSPWGRKESDTIEWLNNSWAGHHQLSYKIHFSSHIAIWLRNGSLLWCTIWEDDTSEQWFLKFTVSSQDTHLPSFFTFPICFKCQMTIEWLTLNSWATSCVVRGSTSMILSVSHCQLLIASHCAPHLQGSSLLFKTT